MPPVPTAETKPSTLPSVCRQISSRGRADMAVAVGDIVELVGPDRAVRLAPGKLLGQPAGHLHVVVRVLVGHRRNLDQLGAEHPQRVLLLLALRVGNDDDGAVAERLGDQRQADAGIAGGALDDDAAGPEQALLLGVADDEQPGAVLDRLARIDEFGLAENLAAGLLGSAFQTDQRRVADRVDHRIEHEISLGRWSRDPRNAGTAFKGGFCLGKPQKRSNCCAVQGRRCRAASGRSAGLAPKTRYA